MKVVVICKSDSDGGAAVVSRRLTEALRREGADARMLVEVKNTGLPYVIKTNCKLREKAAFLLERLQIFFNNGFSRKNLFKADSAAFGLPLWRHPAVKEADAVIINWVNQGMLSLKGVRKIYREGKRVIWVMHDMWNLTGVCHHAMDCRRFEGECGECPLLRRKRGDLSHRVWKKKLKLYDVTDLRFVAVSNWLAGEARKSSLLKDRKVDVIPNAFDILPAPDRNSGRREGQSYKILFSAATLDNWIKGLDTFKEAVEIFKRRHPDIASKTEILLMGDLKNPQSIEGLALPATHLGKITGDDNIRDVYGRADVVVNCSFFENLPGTLVEGQAYGCVPVAFDRGGQRDIIDHLATGYLAPWSDDRHERASAIADGIAWALSLPEPPLSDMRRSVTSRFSYPSVAARILSLLQ